MIKLYFVRHGFTNNNALHAFNGSRSDHGLLPEGRAQATQLGGYLKDTNFLQAYASPLQRAVETAELILQENHQPPKLMTNSLLKELDFGEWDGLPIAAKQNHPQFKNLKEYPEKYDPSEFFGESYPELIARGQKFMQQLDYTQAGNYLIVGHGAMLVTLLQTLSQKALHQVREEGILDNASLSIFTTIDGATFERRLWNFTLYDQG